MLYELGLLEKDKFKCQFHQHFTGSLFLWNSIVQIFYAYSLRL